MKVLVLGAGAMGSVVGGFLAQAGHHVRLVGRETHMSAIARDGLRITGIWGDHRVSALETCCTIEEAPQRDFDLILVTVKSYATEEAARQLTPLLGENTLLCAYQNGLGNAEALAARVGWGRVLGARAIFGARIQAPGWVEVTVIAEPTAIGAYDSSIPRERVHEIVEAMAAAGLPTVHTDRIGALLWGKVAYNCALNPLSALLDVPYGALARCEHTRAIMEEVVVELYETAAAMKVSLEPDTASAYLKRFYEALLPPTAAHYASMREDLKQKRRTEIDALNGAIVRFGARHGLTCPANALLTRLVHAREQF